MAKKGRPKKIMSNPFNKDKDEAKFLSYEHGFNAKNKDLDCPYTKDDGEVFQVWQQGFRANKTRPKAALKDTPDMNGDIVSEYIPTPVGPLTLENISTDLLQLELKKRKLGELNDLLQKEAAMTKALEEINKAIFKLKVLVGD